MPLLTPRQKFFDLVRQGYSRDHATRVTGWPKPGPGTVASTANEPLTGPALWAAADDLLATGHTLPSAAAALGVDAQAIADARHATAAPSEPPAPRTCPCGRRIRASSPGKGLPPVFHDRCAKCRKVADQRTRRAAERAVKATDGAEPRRTVTRPVDPDVRERRHLAVAVAPTIDRDEAVTWRDLARCNETDPEAFFPEKGGSTKSAKAVCARCDVSAECLADALATGDQFGVRGGRSSRERRRMPGFRKTDSAWAGYGGARPTKRRDVAS